VHRGTDRFANILVPLKLFRTTFPNCAPDSRYSCAARHSASGKTLSTTGFSFPAATSFSTVANSSFVPMYEPKIESCRTNRNRMSILASKPVVAPQVTSRPRERGSRRCLPTWPCRHVRTPRPRRVGGHLSHGLANLFLVMMDCFVGAELFCFRQFLIGACCRYHAASKKLRNLNRCRANAAPAPSTSTSSPGASSARTTNMCHAV